MSYIENNGYFVFGDVKSSDYGVWISGGGTFNAPARRYKEYVVPGRNGTLTIDEGAYEEQEVAYQAFIARDFPANVEAFRNAIMAHNGYVRMTDSYHPDEFYLARYMAGLEVDTLPGGRGGSFELTFRRDPRRFLLAGEETVTYPPGEISKNLIPYPYTHTTETVNGITFTDNGDGTVTADGTATAFANHLLRTYDTVPSPQLVTDQEYILNGCPEGGSNTTYYLRGDCLSGYSFLKDFGQGVTFTYDSNRGCYIDICIANGVTVHNLVFKPMLRKASDPPGWQPYYDGSTQIYNPTLFPALPLIRVTGSGTIGIGDSIITVSPGYSYVDIDSEIQDCYCGLQNANASASFSDRKFPELKPGLNSISLGTGVTSVAITPRYYRL